MFPSNLEFVPISVVTKIKQTLNVSSCYFSGTLIWFFIMSESENNFPICKHTRIIFIGLKKSRSSNLKGYTTPNKNKDENRRCSVKQSKKIKMIAVLTIPLKPWSANINTVRLLYGCLICSSKWPYERKKAHSSFTSQIRKKKLRKLTYLMSDSRRNVRKDNS